MRKRYDCLISSLFAAVIVALTLTGYYLYENLEISKGIGAPLGVCAVFVAGLIVESILTVVGKPKAASVVTVVRYVLLGIGLPVTFSGSLMGIAFMALLPIIGWAIALAGMASRWLIIVLFAVVEVCAVVEFLLHFVRHRPQKKAVIVTPPSNKPPTDEKT